MFIIIFLLMGLIFVLTMIGTSIREEKSDPRRRHIIPMSVSVPEIPTFLSIMGDSTGDRAEALRMAYDEIKEIEINAGLYQPIYKTRTIPAEYRKEMVTVGERIQIQTFGEGPTYLEPQEIEVETKEVLVPERQERYISMYKPMEGFYP